ncbi:MAG: DNA cytosine methyltransferase [Bryobacteraceae bacterium]
MNDKQLIWYEFFAGGGMARLGFGDAWKCAFANEWCEKKAAAYTARFGVGDPPACPELKVEDVAKLTAADLPGEPDLIWGSFPCQDLSLAGKGAGLRGNRSGTFWPFWSLIQSLIDEGRAPRLVVIENVVGAITSHGGKDFLNLFRMVAEGDYLVGPMVMGALHFLPQSRPRLFIVAARKGIVMPPELVSSWPSLAWHPKSLRRAWACLPTSLRSLWLWWNLPEPPVRETALSDLIEDSPAGVDWHTQKETERLMSLMSTINRRKLIEAQSTGVRKVGTVYRRTRQDESGQKIQRAEVRFDDVSGCLRTPVGGSSRQFVLIVEGKRVRSRLLSPREAARLMGVPEDYPLPDNYNDAYHLLGDGLVVPAVTWLDRHLLLKLAASKALEEAA